MSDRRAWLTMYEFLTKHGVKPEHIKMPSDKPPLSQQVKIQGWANALYGRK